MANKVYIPNLVINEISDSLIDQVAEQVGDKLTVDPTNLAKLDEENTFLHAQNIPQIATNGVLSANKLNISSTVGVDIDVQFGSNDSRQISMTDAHGIQISSRDSTHLAQVIAGTDSAGIQFNEKMIAIGHDGPDMSTPANIIMSHTPTIITPTDWATMTDNEVPTKKQIVDITDNKVSKTGPETIEGVKTFASIPLCSHTPTNGSQLANKDYVDSVVGSGDNIPLSISNQMATYDATTLNSVKWDFGDSTYAVLGTDETNFTTKTTTSGGLNKTADVIIGTAGAYAIPDDLLQYFGLSMKEMGQIPIGFSVTSNGNNIGGLGIGGATDALVLWGGKTAAGTRANCISIQPSEISLVGQGVSDDGSINIGSVNIANGKIVLDTKVGVTIHLGNSGILEMDARAISEFKRVLGIQ